MLYRTNHPFSFSHLLSPSSPRRLLPSPAFPPPSPLLSLQVEMERSEEGAMKHGLSRPEMLLRKSNQQPISEDVLGFNSQNGISADDFSVDDLLDFSKHGIADEIPEVREEKPEIELEKPSAFSVKTLSKSNLTVLDDLHSVSCEEFNVPAGGLEDLEWLSHFVDDSFSGYSLPYPHGKLPENPETDHRTLPVDEKKPCLTPPVQTKARSKRARTGGRIWSIGSGSLTESSTNSSTSSSSTYSSPNSNPCLIYAVPSHSQTAESLMGHPPAKKLKKKQPETTFSVAGPAGCGSLVPRRCSHCLVQKTPQWRAGPLGAKTLCNACGVRFKSGRLLPEYRPACSPTFSTELHSNNHRKVMEMRRKKEVDDVEEMVLPPAAAAAAVTSF